MEHSDPLLIELVIQIPIQCGEANTILANELILENWVVIIKLKDQFEGFKFILIHVNACECNRLVPDCRVLLIFLLGLLNLVCTSNFEERVRGSCRIFALNVPALNDCDSD